MEDGFFGMGEMFGVLSAGAVRGYFYGLVLGSLFLVASETMEDEG